MTGKLTVSLQRCWEAVLLLFAFDILWSLLEYCVKVLY